MSWDNFIDFNLRLKFLRLDILFFYWLFCFKIKSCFAWLNIIWKNSFVFVASDSLLGSGTILSSEPLWGRGGHQPSKISTSPCGMLFLQTNYLSSKFISCTNFIVRKLRRKFLRLDMLIRFLDYIFWWCYFWILISS